MIRYAPRPIRFDGVHAFGAWRVKTYVITHGERPFARARFDGAERLARGALPETVAPERPGAAFLVLHQGNGADYAVLGWWDRENELPLRVWIRDGEEWRAARGGESLCVWDLQVVWHEREAWVATVLADGDAAAVDAYLARALDTTVAPPIVLDVLAPPLAVVRLAADAPVPAWATAAPFHSVTRTADELSIVCEAARVPDDLAPPPTRDWRALRVRGPLDFALVGILARIASALAAAGVSVFPVATHDTDYVLVREPRLADAVAALRRAGCEVS